MTLCTICYMSGADFSALFNTWLSQMHSSGYDNFPNLVKFEHSRGYTAHIELPEIKPMLIAFIAQSAKTNVLICLMVKHC